MVSSVIFDAVELLLYAPKSPILDYAVVFLWLMSVGTVFIASVWSHVTSPKKNDEQYNELSPKVYYTLHWGFYINIFFFELGYNFTLTSELR